MHSYCNFAFNILILFFFSLLLVGPSSSHLTLSFSHCFSLSASTLSALSFSHLIIFIFHGRTHRSVGVMHGGLWRTLGAMLKESIRALWVLCDVDTIVGFDTSELPSLDSGRHQSCCTMAGLNGYLDFIDSVWVEWVFGFHWWWLGWMSIWVGWWWRLVAWWWWLSRLMMEAGCLIVVAR